MKNIYLFFVVLLLPVAGFSQAGSVPTIGQVYNYQVGDTFEYLSDNLSNWNPIGASWNYTMDVYFYRKDYGNDSIVYGYKEIKFDTSSYEYSGGSLGTNAAVDTAIYTIIALDSGIYYDMGYYDTIDSTMILIESNDTIYEEWDHYYSNLCEGEDGNVTTLGIDSSQYEAGLGEIYSGGTIECFSGWTKLIYYHKVNGQQGGTPFEFTTGLKELPGNNTIQLFPNPATTNFQLQFTSQPADKTYLQLYNGLGQQVMEREISSSSTSINRGKLVNGIYFWQVLQGDEILQRGKLILQ